MRIAIVLCIVAAVAGRGPAVAESPGRAWYVDCSRGDRGGDGLTPETAWPSSSAFAGHEFGPGDTIYFRRGTTCAGMLTPRGSGSAAAPIQIDAWGSGPLPVIQARPGEKAALKLFDQEYWTVARMEFSGGQPRGIFVSGQRGTLHGIHIVDVVVHGVTGAPRDKEGGLLVVSPGSVEQRFDDVLIDGITAYGTTQWAGILVGSATHGYLPESARSTNVTVRNSIVHDVAGDGIILFQVNRGLIENSVAWRTGMQKTETIGTPNAIWTWMCRDCTVRRNEAFLTRSPGIDGGAFDIDYGNANNVVEGNYGHDTQGYCVALFGAGQDTTNSIIRNNTCANNGASPRLARRQGAVFLSTWDGGKLDGVRIENNHIDWSPQIDAPALINDAHFAKPGHFDNNLIRSSVPTFISSNAGLKLEGNRYESRGGGATVWRYASKSYLTMGAYQKSSGQDATGSSIRNASPIRDAMRGTEAPPSIALRRLNGDPVSWDTFKGDWLLVGFISRGPQSREVSRGQVAYFNSAREQFRASGLQVVLVDADPQDPRAAGNLIYDWHLWDVPILLARGESDRQVRELAAARASLLIGPDGKVAWRHNGELIPAELGIALRGALGEPRYAEMP